jgi:hypothetical protein
MNRLFQSLGAVAFCIVLVFAGCTTVPNEGLAQSKSQAARMPPNYRALIARYILSNEPFDKKTLSTAKISKPFTQGGGLFGGEPIPVVCVSIYTSNMLGMHFTGYLEFTVNNGQAVRLKGSTAIISETCGEFSPFFEVMKR